MIVRTCATVSTGPAKIGTKSPMRSVARTGKIAKRIARVRKNREKR